MGRKYEFVEGDTITVAPGRTVKRIRALVAIAAFGVMPGDLGGYVEAEANLCADGNAWVSGNATKTPIQIGGLTWGVTVADSSMVIGCQHHALDVWWRFDDATIDAMDSRALDFWRTYKAAIFELIRANGRLITTQPAVEA